MSYYECGITHCYLKCALSIHSIIYNEENKEEKIKFKKTLTYIQVHQITKLQSIYNIHNLKRVQISGSVRRTGEPRPTMCQLLPQTDPGESCFVKYS